MRRPTAILALVFALPLFACGEDEPAPAPAPSEDPAPIEEPPEDPATALRPPADANEACARVVVVAWQGALAAGDDVTRSEEEARARAEELRGRLEEGADFGELARAESDASASGPRGGLLGTYTREDWPDVHAPISDGVFALQVNQLSEVMQAPYGYVVAQRCPVEKVNTRHILIRYAGADRAPDDVTRTQQEARTRADDLRAQLDRPGADFEALAREHSEDGSAENGGHIGSVGRGLLQQPYEEAAFALEPNEISPVVETRYGYHVIQRLPDEG